MRFVSSEAPSEGESSEELVSVVEEDSSVDVDESRGGGEELCERKLGEAALLPPLGGWFGGEKIPLYFINFFSRRRFAIRVFSSSFFA